MTGSDDALLSYVYASAATTPFSDDALVELLAVSRQHNADDGLTGMLLYRDAHFLQVLEGPADAVRTRMSVIATDPRHTGVRVLIEEDVHERQFPEWTMGYEAIDASAAASIPGYRSTFDDLEQGDDLDRPSTVRALRALIGWFRDRAAADAF